jgi:NAD+ synthase (glutamine-hydrolysing)
MRIHNPAFSENLESEISASLAILRKKRGFVAEKYLKRKLVLINRYFRRFKLSACVVAVSGGIDSSVTLGLVCRAAKIKGSPIKKIIAAMIPVFDSRAATNQVEALARGRGLIGKTGVRPAIIDLTEVHRLMKKTVDDAARIKGKPWAAGQLVSYIRTPALYYLTSLLAQEGYPAVLCGTTNRDEGAYLGYVGKASDGMVDLQMISDLHKSEVYSLARLLGMPKNIMAAVPTGDMFDGRTDEEVFGAPYDFVEFYLLFKSEKKRDQARMRKAWSKQASGQFAELAGKLEALHKYNSHKYLVGSPAVHLDIHESGVPGGWPRRKNKLIQELNR